MTEAERKHPCPTNGKWWVLSPECRHCFHYDEDLDRENAHCMLGYHERKRKTNSATGGGTSTRLPCENKQSGLHAIFKIISVFHNFQSIKTI